MINQLGMPTIFLTLNAADNHWVDLFKLLTGLDDVSMLTNCQRQNLIRDNPQIVDQFFDMRINAFIENVSINNILFSHYTHYEYYLIQLLLVIF